MTTPHTAGHTHPFANAAKPTSRRPIPVVEKSALFASVLFSGLFAGFLIGVLVLEFSLRSFDASVYTQVRVAELAHLDDLASVLLPGAIITTAVLLLATIMRRESGRWLVLAALVILAAIFVISLAVNVPINTAQHSWAVSAPPGDWASLRDRWQIAHLARSTLALLSFATLIAVPTKRLPPAKRRVA